MMAKNQIQNSLIEVKCLSEKYIPIQKLDFRVFRDYDKRHPEKYINKFLAHNKEVLSFLGIKACYHENKESCGVLLTTSSFIGAIPLKDYKGRWYKDLKVNPRFGEDPLEFADLLQEIIEPEFNEEAPLTTESFRAPLYFDCVNYFNLFEKSIHETWNKFDVRIRVESHPCSSTNWERYALKSANPSNTLKYENKKNIISREHDEWKKLLFVLKIALLEFESYRTPASIKHRYSSVYLRLKRYSLEHQSQSITDKFRVTCKNLC